MAPEDLAEIAAATGAMLSAGRTWEGGQRMAAEEAGSVDYPFSGPMFLLTHRGREVQLLPVLLGDGIRFTRPRGSRAPTWNR